MSKDQIIASITERILCEQRKHKNLDWVKIAAMKIYSTHIAKEKLIYPVIDNISACNHEFIPKKCWVHKCIKCGTVHVEYND